MNKLSTQLLGSPPGPQDPHAELEAWARRVLPHMQGYGKTYHTVKTWADDLARILARVDGEGERGL